MHRPVGFSLAANSKPVRERVHAIAAVEPNNSDTYGAVFHGKGGEGDLHLAMLLVLGKPEGGCYHDGGSCFCGYNRRGEGDECKYQYLSYISTGATSPCVCLHLRMLRRKQWPGEKAGLLYAEKR